MGYYDAWEAQHEHIQRACARAFAEPVTKKLHAAAPRTPTYYERKAQEFETEKAIRAWMESMDSGFDKLYTKVDLLLRKLDK